MKAVCSKCGFSIELEIRASRELICPRCYILKDDQRCPRQPKKEEALEPISINERAAMANWEFSESHKNADYICCNEKTGETVGAIYYNKISEAYAFEETKRFFTRVREEMQAIGPQF